MGYCRDTLCLLDAAYLTGWGHAALPDAIGGWFWVYILAPILGGTVAALLFKFILEPINKNKD